MLLYYFCYIPVLSKREFEIQILIQNVCLTRTTLASNWHGIGLEVHSNPRIYILKLWLGDADLIEYANSGFKNFDSLVSTCVCELCSCWEHSMSLAHFCSFSIVWQWIFIHAVHDLTILNGSQIGRKSGQVAATCLDCYCPFESLHT